eukprot:gnl/MRDRNA2_/MRDRNA2_30890_c0_seq1.p1 gnl/MRDRNA2_/MRDRNA2_30890_c0~~gnl/MRDRNA2_/MRDRNA2_30890_c0_seq1.p1  ORF type:complete len:259 (-),score=51.06 gnl/MRDRNA2_/MRDRNA2_30890_c0_seq1:261-1037(-)
MCGVLLSQNSALATWLKPGAGAAFRPMDNFVPVRHDISDLASQLNWLREHEIEAAEIAQRGCNFARTGLTYKSVLLYVARTILEYGSRVSQEALWQPYTCLDVYKKYSSLLFRHSAMPVWQSDVQHAECEMLGPFRYAQIYGTRLMQQIAEQGGSQASKLVKQIWEWDVKFREEFLQGFDEVGFCLPQICFDARVTSESDLVAVSQQAVLCDILGWPAEMLSELPEWTQPLEFLIRPMPIIENPDVPEEAVHRYILGW